MSGITGVFMRSGAAADPRAVRGMAATTPHRAADGAWHIIDGSFSAVRQLTALTPEDRAEAGPIADPLSGLVMLFDGRLDNREELLVLLRESGIGATDCDARLALEAWKAWGTAAPARLIGDFAFVVWSPRDRRLACVRDAIGVRPFFYYLSDAAVVFGSEMRQVLAHPLVPRVADEVAIAELLTYGDRFVERTLYRDIRRLPPAHVAVIDASRFTLTRYWDFDLSRELRLRDDREYAEAFRERFDRAVSAHLRTDVRPVGADLSGGLDSSSIVATARALGATSSESLLAFSMIFPGHPAADERSYRAAVLRHTGVAGIDVLPPAFDARLWRARAEASRDLPDFPNDAAIAFVRHAMASRGIRVALGGAGAEEALVGSFFHYADLLRAGRLLGFARRYRTVASQPDMSWRSAEILKSGVWPALPVALRRALRPLARHAFAERPPSLLDPAFVRRTSLDALEPLRAVPPRRLARYDAVRRYGSALTLWKRDLIQAACARFGIEERYPFYDRRVVEFMVSLPDEQRWQRGTVKYVLRQAMVGRLPDAVTQRSDASKADFTHLFDDALEALGGESFFSDRLHVGANGWIIPARARDLYHAMVALRGRDLVAHADAAWRLWAIAAIEMWYRVAFVDAEPGSTSWRIPTTGVATNRNGKSVQPAESRIIARP